MSKKTKIRSAVILVIWLVVTFVGSIVIPGHEKHEDIQTAMRDAVLHEANKVSFFGLTVNPAVLSGFILVIVLLVVALLLRIFVIPKFKNVPGKLQMLIEELVNFFDNLAKTNSPHRNKFLGAYVFTAGVYIFFGTMSELLGIQVLNTAGHSISLPAPQADINCAICMGCLSYLIILGGGIIGNGAKGIALTLKEFSLPISMSFRLFGALLSGLLVTDLVYYFISLSYVLPVIVGVMFTCIHALVQAYVLCTLVTIYYGEVSEKKIKPKKVKKQIQAGSEG